MDKSLIPQYTEALPDATDDQLIWLYKVCLSQEKDKAAFKQLSEKVQKERKKRGKLVTISSKIIEPKLTKPTKPEQEPEGASPDDY